MTDDAWAALPSARSARHEALPGMVRRALRVLADLVEDADHPCSLTLHDGPCEGGDVAAAVRRLLPGSGPVAGGG